MNLETVYYLSQIIAVIAVVASLVFVGIQIRLSTQQAKADAADTAHRAIQDWYQSATAEQVALNARAMRDFSSLSGEEKQLVYLYGMRMMMNLQEVHSKWSDGSFPDDRWQFWDAWASSIMSPLMKRLWADRGYLFSARFQTYFEGKVAEKGTQKEGSVWGLASEQADSADDAPSPKTPADMEPDA